jgi:type III restriction enzyme
MPKRTRTKEAKLDEFAFFTVLHQFYEENKGRIRSKYRELSKRFLDYNEGRYLRRPQFEALEMYVFLKEFLDNQPVHAIFESWANKQGRFEGRNAAARAGQLDMFGELTKEQYDAVFARMKAGGRTYPNYIFALTMGTGKTILMATCIFYEFILANKFPKDPKYCHNAIVFAPDTTVLEALREIQTFDKRLVVPPEYVNALTANIQFHFLDEAGMTLNTFDRSMFNLIISNTQKVILKRQNKDRTAVDTLFRSAQPVYEAGSVYDEFSDLYLLEDETELSTNQRFQKLQRLTQLGVFIDEAHHAFGKDLARDVGAISDTRQTSLRLTVDRLAESLDRAGTHMVACYNYTGTPYAQNEILPEVVYAYGLKEAIEESYLKQVRINGYSNVRSAEFIDVAVGDFIAKVGNQRYEDMLPKLAFFAATIDELDKELRPAVEMALAKRGIPSTRILVNVGDDKLTSNDEIREFNRLDSPQSEKQFILLVNKGREGWNCRSLFGVGLYRKPKSRIFVLQATMRCLRSITDVQQVGSVYLSNENVEILRDELAQNFRISMDEFTTGGTDNETYQVRLTDPPVKIKLKRVRHMFVLKDKMLAPGTSLQLDEAEQQRDRYQVLHETIEGLPLDQHSRTTVQDISFVREQQRYSKLTLVAEIARYLNKPCLAIEEILDYTEEGTDRILALVNEFNEFLYDWVIPRLFRELYDIQQYDRKEEDEVLLIKVPDQGYYEIRAATDKVIRQSALSPALSEKSFHLDTYCFDSAPERKLFECLLRDERVQRIYFTGMLTHGQSEFFVQYIDPESNMLRSYYPDFLIERTDGSYLIVEVKGDNKVDDPVVLAKQTYARQLAVDSGMTYEMIKGSDAIVCNYGFIFGESGLVTQNLF